MKTITRNRVKELFNTGRRDLLSIYYTAGFPKLDDTVKIAMALRDNGVDMIEIGIPFSDPIADGPVIQSSNKVALANGMNLSLLLHQVEEMRKKVDLPIVLMGYLNPILQYGMKPFCQRTASIGVDGLIIPDLPLYQYITEFKSLFEELGLISALLVAPTTYDERIQDIDAASSGFIYAVSSSGTTGAKDKFSDDQLAYFQKLYEMELRNPFLIGFGISNAFTFQQACKCSRGAIIGSAFVSALQENKGLDMTISKFVKGIRI